MTRAHMFRINTSGPGFRRPFESIDAACDWAQTYMPLKRGWTIERDDTRRRDGIVRLIKRNSRGAVLKGHGVIVIDEQVAARALKRAQRASVDGYLDDCKRDGSWAQ